MNGFDIGVLALVAAAVLVGLWNGLVRILVGLGALVLAFVLAARYHPMLAERLPSFGARVEARSVAAYVLIFVGILLVSSLVGWLLRRLIQAATLGFVDRLGGAALGLVFALLFAAFVVVPVVAYAPSGSALLADSRLAPYVEVVADLASRLVPASLRSRYEGNAEPLRRRWRERLLA
jgi:membrane protein required for colicin V production